MNKLIKRLVLLALAAAGALILSGCASNPQDSSVPWSRPADWEGKLPGVGGM
jgi:starvation-inducible outer membrane lipoprotein